VEPFLTAAGKNCFEHLRQWRTETANARGVDPDIVFSNDTLMQIAASRPTSVAALQEIQAVGCWKAQAYGPALLKLLRNNAKS
jgi:ATP-dependent DNA helicase RecQ